MWNKLFKKKQSKPSNKSQSDVTKQIPASTTKCFSFRSGRKSEEGENHKWNQHFPRLQYESEIYRKPGEETPPKVHLKFSAAGVNGSEKPT